MPGFPESQSVDDWPVGVEIDPTIGASRTRGVLPPSRITKEGAVITPEITDEIAKATIDSYDAAVPIPSA
jgi:hypothetical protein